MSSWLQGSRLPELNCQGRRRVGWQDKGLEFDMSWMTREMAPDGGDLGISGSLDYRASFVNLDVLVRLICEAWRSDGVVESSCMLYVCRSLVFIP